MTTPSSHETAVGQGPPAWVELEQGQVVGVPIAAHHKRFLWERMWSDKNDGIAKAKAEAIEKAKAEGTKPPRTSLTAYFAVLAAVAQEVDNKTGRVTITARSIEEKGAVCLQKAQEYLRKACRDGWLQRWQQGYKFEGASAPSKYVITAPPTVDQSRHAKRARNTSDGALNTRDGVRSTTTHDSHDLQGSERSDGRSPGSPELAGSTPEALDWLDKVTLALGDGFARCTFGEALLEQAERLHLRWEPEDVAARHRLKRGQKAPAKPSTYLATVLRSLPDASADDETLAKARAKADGNGNGNGNGKSERLTPEEIQELLYRAGDLMELLDETAHLRDSHVPPPPRLAGEMPQACIECWRQFTFLPLASEMLKEDDATGRLHLEKLSAKQVAEAVQMLRDTIAWAEEDAEPPEWARVAEADAQDRVDERRGNAEASLRRTIRDHLRGPDVEPVFVKPRAWLIEQGVMDEDGNVLGDGLTALDEAMVNDIGQGLSELLSEALEQRLGAQAEARRAQAARVAEGF